MCLGDGGGGGGSLRDGEKQKREIAGRAGVPVPTQSGIPK